MIWQKGLRDVIIRGGTDLYICRHRHLMAHLVRSSSLPQHEYTSNTAPCSLPTRLPHPSSFDASSLRSVCWKVRKGEERSWPRGAGPGDGSMHYAIVGRLYIQLHTALSFIAGSTTINCSIKIVLIVLITIVRTWALPVQCMALPVRCSSSKLEQDIEDFEDASAAAAEVPIE